MASLRLFQRRRRAWGNRRRCRPSPGRATACRSRRRCRSGGGCSSASRPACWSESTAASARLPSAAAPAASPRDRRPPAGPRDRHPPGAPGRVRVAEMERRAGQQLQQRRPVANDDRATGGPSPPIAWPSHKTKWIGGLPSARSSQRTSHRSTASTRPVAGKSPVLQLAFGQPLRLAMGAPASNRPRFGGLLSSGGAGGAEDLEETETDIGAPPTIPPGIADRLDPGRTPGHLGTSILPDRAMGSIPLACHFARHAAIPTILRVRLSILPESRSVRCCVISGSLWHPPLQ